MKLIYMEQTLIRLAELGFKEFVDEIINKGILKINDEVKYVVLNESL